MGGKQDGGFQVSNEVSDSRELDFLHRELELLYRGRSVDWVLINQYWRKIDLLEERVGSNG
jgi:hypothetical protein